MGSRLPSRCGVLAAGLVVALVLASACSLKAPRQTELMKKTNMTISAAALRVQVRSLAGRFSGLMEEAGEEVLQSTQDPQQRRNALIWLTSGIPAMQQALFQPDPLAALVDSWFLIAQLRRHFAADSPHAVAEENRAIANRMLDAMEADLELIIDSAGPGTDSAAARKLIYERAAMVPIDESFASRRGSATMLAEFTSHAGGNALRSIGSITETVADLVARIDLDAEYIPKLARWHAMLLMEDETRDGELGEVFAAVQQLHHLELVASEVERLAPLVERLPEMVAEERALVLDAVHGLLLETETFVDGQRTELMHEDVRHEREAVLAALQSERMVVLATIAEERRIVLEAVSGERAAFFQDLDNLMDTAFTREIDKVFVRFLVLISVLLGGLASIAYVAVRAVNRKAS